MVTCREQSGLLIYIGLAFQQQFYNGIAFQVGEHPHKQPFQ